jgi:hypothetical protein
MKDAPNNSFEPTPLRGARNDDGFDLNVFQITDR